MEKDVPELLTETVNGKKFRYLDYKGEGQAVVLVHATGFIPWLWHPVAKALSKKYRVIAPCLSSHREPDPVKKDIGWKTLADDVTTLIRQLDIEKPYLVGHSMGGTLVTLCASLFNIPARKIVVIEPIYLPKETYGVVIKAEDHPMASKAIKRGYQWRDREECRAYFLERPFFQVWDRKVLELYLSYGLVEDKNGGVTLYCSPEKEAAIFLGSSQIDPWPFIPEVSCPVLVMEGETSENKMFLDLKKTAGLFQDGTYHQVPGVGHLIPMEKPIETFEIIDNFFLN